MQQNKRFLAERHIKGTYIQIGEVNNVMFVSGQSGFDDFLAKNTNKDLYFCGNIDSREIMLSKTKDGGQKNPKRNRASDIDITEKKYVYFDFDIRDILEKKGHSISDDEIKQLGKEMGDVLLKDDLLKEWSDIVFSGNGIHVHYIDSNPTTISLTEYGVGYDIVCKRLERLLGFNADLSCKNPARIARLPGSYNNKRGQKKLVEFIATRDVKSDLISKIISAGAKECKRRTEVRQFEIDLQGIRKREGLYNTDEIIEKINAIPIEKEVLKDYSDWRFDGKNFWRSVDNERATSAFKTRKLKNALIISGSRWFASIPYKGVGTYLYRREMSGLSNKETINFFKSNYNL